MEKETIHQMLKKEQLQVEIETNSAKQIEEKRVSHFYIKYLSSIFSSL